MKKSYLFVLVLSLVSGLLFAGGTEEKTGPERVELQWTHRAGSRVTQFQELADAFNASQSRVTVNVQHIADAYNEVIQTQFLAGEGPDIFTHKDSEIPAFVDAGWMLDIKNEPFVAHVDAAAKQVFTYEGGLYALPFEAKGWGLWVNNDMFAAAGAEVPTTIEEFIETCELFKAAGQEPLATGYVAAWFIGQTVTYGATSVLVPLIQADKDAYDSGRFTFDTEEFRTYVWMLEAIRKYAPESATDIEPGTAEAAFANGDFPMFLAGQWSVGAVRNANPDLNATIYPLPVSDDPVKYFPTSYGSLHFNANIDKPAMREFMDFWFDDGPIMKKYYESVGLAPLIGNYTVDITIDPMVRHTARMTKEGLTLPTYQYYAPPGSGGEVWSQVQAWFLDKDATPDDLIKTLDSIWKEYWEASR